MKKRRSKYKPLPVSKKNTSRKASKAKLQAMKVKKPKKGIPKKASGPKKLKFGGKPYSYRLSALNPQTPKQLPETPLSKKGLTLRKLLRGTPKLMIHNARDVELLSLKKTKTRSKMPAIKAETYTDDPWRPGKVRRKHKTFIIGADVDDDGNPSQKPVNRHRKVICSCDCVTGDTKVLTTKGWKEIYEIAQPLVPDHYPIDYVINGKVYAGSAPFYKGRQKVWTVTLSNGKTITATKDHKFLTDVPRETRNKWVSVGNMDIGDRVLLNEYTPDTVEHTDEFYDAFLIGVIQGDGTAYRNGFDLQLYDHKEGLLNVISKTEAVADVTENARGIRVTFNNRAPELIRRFDFQNKKGARTRNLTQFMGYLSGLIATDGTVYANGDVLIRGAKDYLEQTLDSLIAYGYSHARLYCERAEGTTTNYGESTKDLYALRISNMSVFRMLDSLLLMDYHKDRIEATGVQRPRKAYAKVVSKSYAGKQHVYDITVPGPTRFVANGTIAHNCENYVFTWEYANAAHGASRIVYGNGNPPVVTNPNMAYGLCKHLVAVATEIIKTGK